MIPRQIQDNGNEEEPQLTAEDIALELELREAGFNF